MSTLVPHQRRSKTKPNPNNVKMSVSLDVDFHARVKATATKRGVSMSQLTNDALILACKGIIVTDRNRSKPKGSVAPTDRQDEGDDVSGDD